MAESTSLDAQDTQGTAEEINLDTIGIDEFQEKLKTDPVLQKDYLRNPEDPKYDRINSEYYEFKMTGKKPEKPAEGLPQGDAGAASQSAAQPGATGAAGSTDEDFVEVSAKIPKNLFGSYLVNDRGERVRKPEEALLEALKGNHEKDRYINSLRTQTSGLMTETASLRSQLVAQMQSPQGSAAQEARSQDEVDFAGADDINQVEDLFVPEQQERLLKGIKALVGNVKKVAATSKQPQQPAGNPEELSRKMTLDEIRSFQMMTPQLATSVDFEVLDREMTSFYNGIQAVSGRNVSDAWSLYNANTPEGQTFRDSCAQRNVMIPPEHNKHATIMSIKLQRDAERKNLADAMTQTLRAQGRLKLDESLDPSVMPVTPGMSFVDFWQKSQVQQPAYVQPVQAQVSSALQQQIDQRRSEQQSTATPTVPHGASAAPLIEITQMTEDDFNRLTGMGYDKMGPDDAQTLIRLYEYLNDRNKQEAHATGQEFQPIPIDVRLKKRAGLAV